MLMCLSAVGSALSVGTQRENRRATDYPNEVELGDFIWGGYRDDGRVPSDIESDLRGPNDGELKQDRARSFRDRDRNLVGPWVSFDCGVSDGE